MWYADSQLTAWGAQGNTENRSIINVSSTTGLHGNVGQANYAAAKSAVIGLSKTVCKEWGPFGVRANTVAFGYILTRLTAAKEAGATIEIDGKKVALGIPGGRSSVTSTAQQGGGSSAQPGIPLGRGATPDEAAAAMLLCVLMLLTLVNALLTASTAWRRRWRPSCQGIPSRSPEERVFKRLVYSTKFWMSFCIATCLLTCATSGVWCIEW